MKLDSSCTALVTGANGGIGQAIARALAGTGAKVIVSGRKPAALQGIAGELGARVIVADLEQRADVLRLVQEAGEVDVLVANAAVPASGPLLEFSDEQIDRAIDVNLRVPMLLARHLVPGMVARRRGQLVLVSSIAGKVTSPGASIYSATKFGLRGFALGFRQDLRSSGVGVTCIYPGFIREAGMFADTGVKLPSGIGTRSPADVAAAVLRAVRKNPAEIDVAAVEQRFGAFVAALSPAFSEWMQGALGAASIGRAIVDGQRSKR